jgi:LuxR family maltose regulon positive regulatory protein
MNNICKTPITLISAPVGYGKTTILRKFFSRTNVICHFFEHLEENSFEEFWGAFCGVILSCDVHIGQKVASLGFSSDSKILSDVFELIGQLKLRQKTVVIFDNFHNAISPEAVRFLSVVAKMAVPNLHIVISSRHNHPEFRDLILNGYVNIITARMFIIIGAGHRDAFPKARPRPLAERAKELSINNLTILGEK